MKIFRIYRQPDGISFCSLPDTAMLITKQPFFVPDFTEHCTVRLCAAVTVTRLGRSIHKEFANRYYDSSAITLGAHFIARDLLDRLIADRLPWDMAIGFDSAVAVAPVGDLLASREALLSLNDIGKSVPVPSSLVDWVDGAIASVSLSCTLRQGDVFLFPLPQPERPVAVNDTLRLCLDGRKVLAFHIK